MPDAMNEFMATAHSHMRRDIQLGGAGGKWVCECEACREIRSLVGMEKMLRIRPLVREIEETEERLEGLANGFEKQRLQEQYLKLQDKLADEMAK
jgi:hypothetical protein